MKNFQEFGLSEALNQSLSKMNYTQPTPIQEKAIPVALQGHDILGSAQTGTGKTAAFSIPLVESLMRSSRGSALVLTPTRELAKQVLDVIHQLLGHKSPIKTAFIIGGESMGKQLTQLKENPRIIVGTPGRINDHLERGSLMLADTGFLVLDETDRMLDMGFGVQLDKIIKFLPKKRQTLMFSATLPDGIVQLSNKYLNNPQRISTGETNKVAVKIKQDIIHIQQEEKYQELIVQLHEREGSVIVFVKTKHGADRIAKNLRRDGFTSEALHGDLRQNKRDKVMQNFRKQNFRIMIATDIAARGLDVPHIEHVINYDLPQVAEDYIHRMGRTARAGAEGSALCFISPQDGRKWHAIESLLDPEGSKKKASKGKSFKKPGTARNGDKPKHAAGKKPRRAPAGQRPENGQDNRPKKRFKKKSEDRSGNTFEENSENRSEHKPKRGNKSQHGNKPKNAGQKSKPDYKSEGKPGKRSEHKSKHRASGKPNNKPGKKNFSKKTSRSRNAA